MMLTLKLSVPITLKPRFIFNVPHQIHFCKSPLNLKTYAQNGGNDSAKESFRNDADNGSKKDRFNFQWRDVFNPDSDNLVAVGLAALLTLASLQVLSQLFFISFAILVAALKYSFIAALLIFILVTLL